MLTEKEARDRWCPFSRAPVAEIRNNDAPLSIAVGNRAYPDNAEAVLTHTRCLASACMAWRWAYQTDVPAEDAGFCGLAGRPE